MLSNPYAGLVVFIAIPAVFVLGLLLIPLGMWLAAAKAAAPSGRGRRRLAGHRLPARSRVRRTALLIAALTAVNIVIMLLAGYGSLHCDGIAGFCGQACHTPMHPQFTALAGRGALGRSPASSATSAKARRIRALRSLSGVRQLSR